MEVIVSEILESDSALLRYFYLDNAFTFYEGSSMSLFKGMTILGS